MNFLNDLLSLFFPKECAACGTSLHKDEEALCLECFFEMPETNYHLYEDNILAKLFWGKVHLNAAAALYFYSKNGKVQKLVHKMKYKGHKDLGEYIGRIYGEILVKSELFSSVDIIIPVPLHKKKERKRGYNQSEYFAKGLSESMKIPYSINYLARIKHSDTQTNKTRYQRWENVKEIFVTKSAEQLMGKHILLVDDVITTGATIESSARTLLSLTDIKVSVAAIAYAGG